VSDAGFGDEGRHRGASTIVTIVERGENGRELYFWMIVIVLEGSSVPVEGAFLPFGLGRVCGGDGAFRWAGEGGAVGVGGGGGGRGGHAACGVVEFRVGVTGGG